MTSPGSKRVFEEILNYLTPSPRDSMKTSARAKAVYDNTKAQFEW